MHVRAHMHACTRRAVFRIEWEYIVKVLPAASQVPLTRQRTTPDSASSDVEGSDVEGSRLIGD